ncbi:unnamed protein product [Lepeophtheirus salmonis]|uniref:(salmon louse) hypothetical protein n=1 Tax=Lepeophtheirus salmonis TaxID=72036 RepID=A0A7R8GZK5_LEPSM|nr:unnamed protein product [Lepeophtheirus salmonis]CAF2754879.1 unnamed protein product [Lepeophtheirus salmonis]
MEIEAAAEEILSSRQEIVDLDRKRQSNREALVGLKKSAKSHWNGEESESWLALGNTFYIALPNRISTHLLEKDGVKFNTEINKQRSNLKVQLHELNDKEEGVYSSSLLGMNLSPLDKDEIAALRKNF